MEGDGIKVIYRRSCGDTTEVVSASMGGLGRTIIACGKIMIGYLLIQLIDPGKPGPMEEVLVHLFK